MPSAPAHEANPSAQAPEPAPSAQAPEPTPPEAGQPPPSVIVDAKDDRGQRVREATVLVDDKPVAYELDGKPIVLTPGPHTITVQRNDGSRTRVSAPVSLAAGQLNQPVHVTLSGHAPEDEQRARMLRPDPPVLPRIVVALGLVSMVTGSVLLLARPALPANCNDTCVREAGQTDEQFRYTQRKAQSHDTVTNIATATLAGGAAVAAAGLLWYFIELPPISQDARALDKPKPRTAMIAPWLAAGAGGLSATGSF